MNQLVPPDEILNWIPGKLTLDSTPLQWEGLSLKGYNYDSLDVDIPAMRDYMIVGYSGDEAVMSRREGGPWCSERVADGTFSLLTRGERSEWKWDRPITVAHIYLPQTEISRVAEDVFERSINDIEMEDCICMRDSILSSLMFALKCEVNNGGLGGNLYRDAILNQLCIHMLRNYATIKFRQRPINGRLANWQRRRLMEYIQENLRGRLRLDDLARESNISISALIRKFRTEFGCTPHAYVLHKRLECAKQLLEAKTKMPLKVIAVDCGFADQSHLVRHFKRAFMQTPAQYRRTLHQWSEAEKG